MLAQNPSHRGCCYMADSGTLAWFIHVRAHLKIHNLGFGHTTRYCRPFQPFPSCTVVWTGYSRVNSRQLHRRLRYLAAGSILPFFATLHSQQVCPPIPSLRFSSFPYISRKPVPGDPYRNLVRGMGSKIDLPILSLSTGPLYPVPFYVPADLYPSFWIGAYHRDVPLSVFTSQVFLQLRPVLLNPILGEFTTKRREQRPRVSTTRR
ncbi:hypothetical protein DFH09DRAFT_306562 [Mycena vulgaris]|nr:hypothetical protein DFH09DRAFT_306562 [Mycena vulgaris]